MLREDEIEHLQYLIAYHKLDIVKCEKDIKTASGYNQYALNERIYRSRDLVIKWTNELQRMSKKRTPS